ncbi:MAG: hypothetical protein HRU26_08115 [Psychroserpens sp.]|nr:hypothetical protein [Psychroserpens sp.]
MKTINLKWIASILIVVVFFQSCSSDDSNNSDGPDDIQLSDPTSQLMVEWNDLWLRLDRFTTGMRPNTTARSLAYIHLAAYETVVHDMDSYSSNSLRYGELNIDNSQQPDNLNIDLALNSCYARVFQHFMYNFSVNIDGDIQSLKSSKETELSLGLSDDQIQESGAWGEYVANQIIFYSQTDTEAESQILEPQPLSYEPPVGDGYWTYSAEPERALFPYWE